MDRPTKDLARTAASALLLFVAIDVLLGSVCLIAGVAMSAAVLPVSAAAAAAAAWLLGRGRRTADRVGGIVLAAIIVCASIALASAFVDMSYDGNSYQKAAIGALAHGWNPVYESIEDYWARAPMELSPVTHALWADHYPKASWLFASSAYALTGSIEAGKAVNLIMGAALALLVWHYLASRFLGRASAVPVAALAAVNPITLPQFLTNYVDGLLACTLLVVIVLLVARADNGFHLGRGIEADALLAATLVICINIKFTGFVYAGFFCGAFWVLELARAGHAEGAGALRSALVRRTGFYLAVIAVSVLVVGATSYVPNTLDHGSPFYPLISSQTVDIVRGYQPDSFEEMNPFKQFALSFFSETSNLWKEDVELKIPFSFSTGELAVSAIDSRRAGFGAFFSGLFIVSGIVCIAGCVVLWRRERREWLSVAAALIVPSVALIGLTDGSWWARYTPYLWIVPLIALVMLLGSWKTVGARAPRLALGTLLGIGLAADVLTFAPAVGNTIECTRQTEAFVETLAERGDEATVSLSDPALVGILYNLDDAGIAYRYETRIPAEDATATLAFVGLSAS